MDREYYLDFSCNTFDLTYYPFDAQMCAFDFEVLGNTDESVRLMIDPDSRVKDGVEFKGKQKRKKIFGTQVNFGR